MRLAEILTPQLATWLESGPDQPRLWTAEELDEMLDLWASQGQRVQTMGFSQQGRSIRCLSVGSGPRSLLAWGYPHPDEPLGASAMVWLAQGLLAGQMTDLDDWTIHLVPCADPDQARLNTWVDGPGDMADLVAGSWRPQGQSGWEVDLGFEVDLDPVVPLLPGMPHRCMSYEECLRRCGPDGCRTRHLAFAPLPESSALHNAMTRFRPDLVATMHSNALAGSYTFLLHRPSSRVLDDLQELPEIIGTGRHLGEPLDAGRRLRTADPDLIAEQRFASVMVDLRRQSEFSDDLLYYLPMMASQVVDAELPSAQVITPEAGLYRHPVLGDRTVVERDVPARVSVEDRRRGRYRVVRVETAAGWVVCHQDRETGPLEPVRDVRLPLTRGMLGVQALARRRAAMAAGDLVWQRVCELPDLVPHPYQHERRQTIVPGAYVGDRAMLIFRTRRDYRRAPTRAEQATFAWQWPLYTAKLLANMRSFLAAQDQERPEIALAVAQVSRLQDAELALIPADVQRRADVAPAMRCMLARVLRVMID